MDFVYPAATDYIVKGSGKAWIQGYQAAKRKQTEESCPYDFDDYLYLHWLDGYADWLSDLGDRINKARYSRKVAGQVFVDPIQECVNV